MPSLRHASLRLGNLDSFHRLRPIGSVKQLFTNLGPVTLQVLRQLADGHAVHTRSTLVGLHSLECLPQVLALAHLLHQRIRLRRALGFSLRHGQFGPFDGGCREFTPSFRREGQ